MPFLNGRKVPLVRELCEELGFGEGAGSKKTRNIMTESTHDWRRTYITPNGTPGKDLIDPKCTYNLFDMAHAYLERGYGEIYWPAKGVHLLELYLSIQRT